MNPKNPEAIRTQILALVKEYHTAKFAPKTFDPDKDLVHYVGRVFDAEEIVNLGDYTAIPESMPTLSVRRRRPS